MDFKEALERIAELESRVSELEAKTTKSRKKSIPTAYEQLRLAIVRKVNSAPYYKGGAGRRLTEDLKWNLKIRYITRITDEQLPDALEYVEKYKLENRAVAQ